MQPKVEILHLLVVLDNINLGLKVEIALLVVIQDYKKERLIKNLHNQLQALQIKQSPELVLKKIPQQKSGKRMLLEV